MAKRPSKQDAAKAKAAKQKKIAIGGAVVLAALLVIEVPKTMKMLNQKPAAPVVETATTSTTPVALPSDPNSLAAPTLGASAATPTATTEASSSDLVDAVPVSADPGQLETFQKFASKDPFAVQASSGGSAQSSGGSSPSSGGSSTPSAPAAAPPAPSSSGGSTSFTPAAPTSANISLNRELMTVTAGGDFPTQGATFDRVGTLFHLVSLTAKTAKIAIVGGSYADGSPAITLHMGTPLTLQNTADGTKYTLILEPPTAQVPASATVTTPTSTPTTSAVPSGSGG